MFSESDLIYIFYIIFFMCFLGLFYICVLVMMIEIVVSDYKTRTIDRQIDVSVKYDNNQRIYERNENVVINKKNKINQRIDHSFKAIDKTNPRLNNLLLSTIVEINDTKEYSDNRNVENKEILSNSGDEYIRHCFEKTTKTLKFDSKGKIIKRTKTKETMDAIDLIEPMDKQQMIKTDIITAKIPIKVFRNKIKLNKKESDIEANAKTHEKTVLDIISYADSGPALMVSSHFDHSIDLEVDSRPSLTKDSIISNIDLKETQTLDNTITMKEVPTVATHLKITEVPVFQNRIQINERRGLSDKSNEVSDQMIDAEVPIIVRKAITKSKIPAVIPVMIRKTKIRQQL